MSGGYLRTSLARAHRPACKTVVVTRRMWPVPLLSRPKNDESLDLLPRGSVQDPPVIPVRKQQRSVTSRHTVSQAISTAVIPEAAKLPRSAPTLPAKLRAETESAQPVPAPTLTRTGSALSASSDPPWAPLRPAHSDTLNGFQNASNGSPLEPEERKQELAITSTNAITEGIVAEVTADSPSAGISSFAAGERVTRVQPPEFRVNWPAANRALPASARAQAEREVIRAARAEFKKCTNSAGIPSESPAVVNVRVESLTVKIESPAPAPAPPWTPTRPASAVNAEGAFSSHFLRRTISGF
jgi:hypothetical protein